MYMDTKYVEMVDDDDGVVQAGRQVEVVVTIRMHHYHYRDRSYNEWRQVPIRH